jgi:hypothetical protein
MDSISSKDAWNELLKNTSKYFSAQYENRKIKSKQYIKDENYLKKVMANKEGKNKNNIRKCEEKESNRLKQIEQKKINHLKIIEDKKINRLKLTEARKEERKELRRKIFEEKQKARLLKLQVVREERQRRNNARNKVKSIEIVNKKRRKAIKIDGEDKLENQRVEEKIGATQHKTTKLKTNNRYYGNDFTEYFKGHQTVEHQSKTGTFKTSAKQTRYLLHTQANKIL